MTTPQPRQRPNPLRWLAYAYGAGLPGRHRTWVLHDVTAPTWVLRHFVRSVVQILPVAVMLFLLIPGDPTVRLAGIVMGAVIGMGYTAMFIEAATEHRAIKAGYPEGFAAHLRHERTQERRRSRR